MKVSPRLNAIAAIAASMTSLLAVQAALALSHDDARREAMGSKARAFVEAHRGAVGRLMAWLEATLAQSR